MYKYVLDKWSNVYLGNVSGSGPMSAVRVVLFGHKIVHKIVHFVVRVVSRTTAAPASTTRVAGGKRCTTRVGETGADNFPEGNDVENK